MVLYLAGGASTDRLLFVQIVVSNVSEPRSRAERDLSGTSRPKAERHDPVSDDRALDGRIKVGLENGGERTKGATRTGSVVVAVVSIGRFVASSLAEATVVCGEGVGGDAVLDGFLRCNNDQIVFAGFDGVADVGVVVFGVIAKKIVTLLSLLRGCHFPINDIGSPVVKM